MLRQGRRRFAAAAAAAATVVRSPPVLNIPASALRAVDLKNQELSVSHLPNGFTVVTEHTPRVNFCTIGVWIDAGSRFETRENNGVAHFLEHVNFKGSDKFSKDEIDTTFEYLGSHFNAYTSRDRTAYYIKTFNDHAEQCMELLADILRNSKHTPRSVELERPTILAEMREVEELVDEVIMDNLHLCAFDSSVSGLPLTILGPTDNISKHIDRKMIRDFVDTHYTGPRMTLVCSGGLTHRSVERLASTFYGDLPNANNRPDLVSRYVGGDFVMWNQTMMTANCAWAVPICGAASPDNIPLQLVHCMLGGYRREQQDLFANITHTHNHKFSARPNLEAIQPFYTPYEETGLFGMYMVAVPGNDPTDKKLLSEVMHSNFDFLHSLASKPVAADTLETVKAHYKAAQLMQMDSTTNRAEEIGRQMIHLKRRVPVMDMLQAVDAVTPADIQRVVKTYFVGARPTVSMIGHPDAIAGLDELSRKGTR